MNLTPHFSLAELTVSQTATRKGLDNTPGPEAMANLRRTALGLEQIRILLGAPIIVSSGYRSPAVNAAVGGARSSQHLTGQAVDFTCPGFGTPKQIVALLSKSILNYDQLIYEGTWVHVSFVAAGARREVLTAHFSPGKPTLYSKGLA